MSLKLSDLKHGNRLILKKDLPKIGCEEGEVIQIVEVHEDYAVGMDLNDETFRIKEKRLKFLKRQKTPRYRCQCKNESFMIYDCYARCTECKQLYSMSANQVPEVFNRLVKKRKNQIYVKGE